MCARNVLFPREQTGFLAEHLVCKNVQPWLRVSFTSTSQPSLYLVPYSDHSPRARHPGVIVKWALGSITTNKASESDRIPTELFQVLKGDSVKVLHSICQHIWKTAMATGLEKVSFHSNPKERKFQRMFKLPYNCMHLTH